MAIKRSAGIGEVMNPTALRILTVAQERFELGTVEKTSIDEIAVRSGVSRQTVYRYFVSKQAILEAIAAREMIAIGQAIRTRIPPDACFADKLTEALFVSVELGRANSYVQLIINDPDMMRRCFDRGGHLYELEQEQWQSFIAAGRRSAELAEDLDDDAIIRWLAMSQLMLLLMAERLPDWESNTRGFIRRLLVQPVLSQRSDQAPLQLEKRLGAMQETLDAHSGMMAALIQASKTARRPKPSR